MEIENSQFQRMQELEQIRFEQSLENEQEKKTTPNKESEFDFHKRMDEKIRLAKLEDLKRYGKIMGRDENR